MTAEHRPSEPLPIRERRWRMFVVGVLVAVPVGLYCLVLHSVGAVAEGLFGAERSPLELPVVGTVGDLPSGESTVRIQVARDGRLVFDGAVVDLDQLDVLLDHKVASQPTKKVLWFEQSLVDVVIEADQALPMGVIGRLHQVLLRQTPHPIVRVFYAVTCESDGELGASAMFLPYDVGGSSRDMSCLPVTLELGRHGAGVHASAVVPTAVAQLRTAGFGTDLIVACEAAEDVPFGYALAVADNLLRVGLRKVCLQVRIDGQGAADRGVRDLQTVVARIGPALREPGMRWLDGPTIEPARRAVPAVARTRGRHAGVAESFRILGPIPPPEPPPGPPPPTEGRTENGKDE